MKLSDNARANIAWVVAVGGAVSATYGLDVLGAPGWLVGTGGAATLMGVMLFAQWKKWISV